MRSVGEAPTASPFVHLRTVRVKRDPQVCQAVQGDIMTERQLVPVRLFAVVVVKWSCRVYVVISPEEHDTCPPTYTHHKIKETRNITQTFTHTHTNTPTHTHSDTDTPHTH